MMPRTSKLTIFCDTQPPPVTLQKPFLVEIHLEVVVGALVIVPAML
jgi:hypothetical protein